LQVDRQKAADDFGSASIGSFKKMIQTAFKKIKDAEANGGVETKPAKAKAGGNKRKGEEVDDEEGGEKAAPVKKRGRKPKKEATLDGTLHAFLRE